MSLVQTTLFVNPSMQNAGGGSANNNPNILKKDNAQIMANELKNPKHNEVKAIVLKNCMFQPELTITLKDLRAIQLEDPKQLKTLDLRGCKNLKTMALDKVGELIIKLDNHVKINPTLTVKSLVLITENQGTYDKLKERFETLCVGTVFKEKSNLTCKLILSKGNLPLKTETIKVRR